jgi:hypothetical protein
MIALEELWDWVSVHRIPYFTTTVSTPCGIMIINLFLIQVYPLVIKDTELIPSLCGLTLPISGSVSSSSKLTLRIGLLRMTGLKVSLSLSRLPQAV